MGNTPTGAEGNENRKGEGKGKGIKGRKKE